jgi:hypothetical protein
MGIHSKEKHHIQRGKAMKALEATFTLIRFEVMVKHVRKR